MSLSKTLSLTALWRSSGFHSVHLPSSCSISGFDSLQIQMRLLLTILALATDKTRSLRRKREMLGNVFSKSRLVFFVTKVWPAFFVARKSGARCTVRTAIQRRGGNAHWSMEQNHGNRLASPSTCSFGAPSYRFHTVKNFSAFSFDRSARLKPFCSSCSARKLVNRAQWSKESVLSKYFQQIRPYFQSNLTERTENLHRRCCIQFGSYRITGRFYRDLCSFLK